VECGLRPASRGRRTAYQVLAPGHFHFSGQHIPFSRDVLVFRFHLRRRRLRELGGFQRTDVTERNTFGKGESSPIGAGEIEFNYIGHHDLAPVALLTLRGLIGPMSTTYTRNVCRGCDK
jgi:hypothetical protein